MDDPRSAPRHVLPPQASDFTVTWRGREVRWLSRLVGTLAALLWRWRRRH